MLKGVKFLNKKNTWFLIGFIFVLVFFFVSFVPVFAVELGIEAVEEEIELGGEDIRVIVARIINVFLGLLAVIALVLVLYGGFLWMTAGGDAEKVAKAKKVLVNAAIGLGIILTSWAITVFIFQALLGEDGVFGPGGRPSGAPPTYESFSGALGNGIIDYHYPSRGATDVPRNTKIMVTFKEAMSIPSFIDGYDDGGTPFDTSDDTVSDLLNNDNIKIYRTADGDGGALRPDQVRVRFTEDLETFVFEPAEWLGSASEDVSYTVSLGANIERADGEDAFQGALSDGYRWNFEVSTFVDVTPPQVRSVFPVAGETYPKNVLVQINFNEPIDPTSASGHSSRFTNILVEGGGAVLGTFAMANQYKTVEFVPDESCGTNTCGGEVFCLPGNADIDVTVRSATMNSGEEPMAVFPYNGVVDMAGNSLDGNTNDVAEGPPTDNFAWSFATTNEVYIAPPGVSSVSPAPGEGGIAPDMLLEIEWDVLMSFSSLNSSNILLSDNQPDEFSLWFYIDSDNFTEEGLPVEAGMTPHHSATVIRHGLFFEETEYYPEIFSDVKDVYQNCYSPAATRNCPKDRVGAPWCCDTRPSASRSSGPCLGIPVKER